MGWRRSTLRFRDFDAAHKPGVRRTESREKQEWGGYAYAVELAVYVSDDNRETVLRVLQSAR
jgi:hypothetical protein